jgi:hypothetical protein
MSILSGNSGSMQDIIFPSGYKKRGSRDSTGQYMGGVMIGKRQ